MVRSLVCPLSLSAYIVILLSCLVGNRVEWHDFVMLTTSILMVAFLLEYIQGITQVSTDNTDPPEDNKTEGFGDVPPPSFNSILSNAVDTEPESITKDGATPEDKEQLHHSESKYGFLDEKTYVDKDPLYYANTGDLVDRSWKQMYTILDTKHWKPYTKPPPVCLDRDTPCKPCPVIMHTPYLDLSQFSGTQATIPILK
jgi:hypothetical protein